MADFPRTGMWIPPPVIGIDHIQALGMGRRLVANSAAPASATWPATNRAILIPFWVPDVYPVASMFVANGATATGNFDLGIYTTDGTLISAKGTTGQVTTNVLQIVTLSVNLGPGFYYMACSMDGTSATTNSLTTTVIQQQMLGIVQASTAFPLPATVTLATAASAYVPLIGLSTLTTY